ncbi:hypothetical protein WDU94_001392 [Cyamophila willieti]
MFTNLHYTVWLLGYEKTSAVHYNTLDHDHDPETNEHDKTNTSCSDTDKSRRGQWSDKEKKNMPDKDKTNRSDKDNTSWPDKDETSWPDIEKTSWSEKNNAWHEKGKSESRWENTDKTCWSDKDPCPCHWSSKETSCWSDRDHNTSWFQSTNRNADKHFDEDVQESSVGIYWFHFHAVQSGRKYSKKRRKV